MPKPTRLVTLTLAAVLAIGLAACGGSPSGRPQAPVAAAADPSTSRPSSPSAPVSGSASAGTSVACGLVTTTEVATAVGYQIAKSEGADSTLAGTDICVFQGTQEGTGLYVTLYNTPKAQELSLSIEPASEQVAGLGDGAFWASSAGLFVKKGSRLLGLHDLTLNAGRDALAALAAQAVARM